MGQRTAAPDVTSMRLSSPKPTNEILPAISPETTATGASRLFQTIVESVCQEDSFRDSANAMQDKELNAILVLFDLKSKESKRALAEKCVTRYRGDYQQKTFSCWDQCLAMAFAQLTYRDSLRDIEACLRSMQGKV